MKGFSLRSLGGGLDCYVAVTIRMKMYNKMSDSMQYSICLCEAQ
jgi:hypothetical protein